MSPGADGSKNCRPQFPHSKRVVSSQGVLFRITSSDMRNPHPSRRPFQISRYWIFSSILAREEVPQPGQRAPRSFEEGELPGFTLWKISQCPCRYPSAGSRPLTPPRESGTLLADPAMKETGPGSFPVGVAYVLPGLGLGGTEKHVLDLASRIDRRRFSPCVISTAEDKTLAGDFAARGIPVHRLPYRGLSLHPAKFLPLLTDALGFFRGFARILEERNVAVLHAYLPAACVLGMAGTIGRRKRVRIVSKRALCRYKDGHPVYSCFENLANLAADAVMVNSRAVAEDVRRTERFAEGKMFLVYNGLEIPPETRREKTTTRGPRDPPRGADCHVRRQPPRGQGAPLPGGSRPCRCVGVPRGPIPFRREGGRRGGTGPAKDPRTRP